MASETTPSQPSDETGTSNNTLLRVAAGFFVVGVLAIVAIFLTPILSEGKPGLVLYLLTLACPIGFVLAITFALRSGRRAR
ncbi:MAG: hypothetical protein GX610_00905 [Rhodococcus sp.]|nr:hypothetical protein [Rhodococcus sp. (in: high G+C Gram-positive bacteria)]